MRPEKYSQRKAKNAIFLVFVTMYYNIWIIYANNEK